jgi:hypothetical protein
MSVRSGIRNRLIEQPRVQLGVAREPQPRLEQPRAQRANLVLYLALLPASRRRARRRFHQVGAAHLQKPAIERAVTTSEYGERPVVHVEHHLLRLAWVGTQNAIRPWHSRACATLTFVVVPFSTTIPSDQSN